LNTASRLLHKKLLKLDLRSLDISEYNQRYLGEVDAEGTLQLYAHLLLLSLYNAQIPIGEFVFVDYGGGSGLLSFLAKEMGVGRVIYDDIYDVSCEDVRRLSRALKLPLDDVVCGDIDDLVSYLRTNLISISAIASYDVIEHIYDIETYMRKLPLLSNASFRVVHASGANIENPFYVRQTKQKQLQAEYSNKEKKWGWKQLDTPRSYLDVRREMIINYAPGLSTSEVEELARLTRGLRRNDIEKCVDEYREKGDVRYRPEHPTNTCDPYTGNWCEHLMKMQWLDAILREAGFSVLVLNGYWSSSGRLHKKAIKHTLNMVIRLLGKRALCISPYYILYAEHKASQDTSTNG
jgi:hypothetical protein